MTGLDNSTPNNASDVQILNKMHLKTVDHHDKPKLTQIC